MFMMKSNAENITSSKVCRMKFSWKFSSCTSWEWDSIRSMVAWGWASAIEIEPDNPSLYSGKSKTLEKLGRIEEARYCHNLGKKSLNKASNLGHNSGEWGESRGT